MAHDFQWLLAMHETAARFGSGLKPELAALLRHDMTRFGPDVAQIAQVPISAGPARQFATKAQLAEAGIPSIAPGTELREGWDRARTQGVDRAARLGRAPDGAQGRTP